MSSPRRYGHRVVLVGALAILSSACVPAVAEPPPPPDPSPDTLIAPSSLLGGESIDSKNGYRFTMQTDGNAVLYGPAESGRKVLWSSRTAGNPGARITMMAGGNLALTAESGKPLWTNGRNGYAGSYLVLESSGNLAQYQPVANGRRMVWSTGTASASAAGNDRNGIGCPEGPNRALCERSASQARSDTAARAIKFALRQVGVPYNSTNRLGLTGYDCSGLVWRSYREAGVDIGANTSGTIVTPGGVRVSVPMSQVKPGDLIWYQGHIAMALADGRMVEAAKPGTKVRVVGSAGRGFSGAVAISAP